MTTTKRALVTGAARGLGRAIVDSLASQGWEVWATDIAPIDPGETRAAHVDRLDVTNAADIERVLHSNVEGFDALVNNAAWIQLVPWDRLSPDDWRRMLEINLTGPFLCCQAVGRAMRDRGNGGAIVNVSSVTFFQGNPSALHYTASKGGVVALTRSLASALGPHGVRVNCVAPGLMLTEGVRAEIERGDLPGDRLLVANDPQRKLAGRTEPAGVADVVAFLVSDAARELTGQLIAAGGGSYYY